MKFLQGFGQFWYDFIIGDDWKIAAAVVIPLLVGVPLVINETLAASTLVLLLGALLIVAFVVSVVIDVRPRRTGRSQ